MSQTELLMQRAQQELSEFFTLSQYLPLEHIRPLQPLFPPLVEGSEGLSTDVELSPALDDDKIDEVPLLAMPHNANLGRRGSGGKYGAGGTSDAGSSRTSLVGDENGEVTVRIHGQDETMPASQVAELRSKVEDLESLVPESSLVGGKTFKELTLYEKKSVLIDRELDLMGMGRYQWCIFFLCSGGYFLDLCWAQVFSLVAPQIQKELDIPESQIGLLFTAFNTGLTVGAFGWGILVDAIGRRWCFNMTCLLATIFGFLFSLPSSFPVLCLLSAGIGLGVGGNIPIDATIVLEFLPKNRRYLLAALSTFQPVGTVVASLMAYALIPGRSCAVVEGCRKEDNMGWRYTIIVLASITLIIFFLRFGLFKFRESPKFLLNKQHDTHALDIIYSIARFNGVPEPGLTMEDFQALEFAHAQGLSGPAAVHGGGRHSREGSTASSHSHSQGEGEDGGESTPLVRQKRNKGEDGKGGAWGVVKRAVGGMFGHLGGVFKSRLYATLFVVLAIAYMSLFFAFSIAGAFLPLILQAKGVDTKQSQAETYRSYVWIYLPGVTATLAASAMMEVPKIGRKWPMVVSGGLMGVSLVLYQKVNSLTANIAFNALEYWFQSLFCALLYAYTPEAFPATYRGSASGTLSTLGRIASVIAPVAAGRVYNGGDSPGVLYLAGGAAWVAMIAVACLPFDTQGKQTF